MGLSNEWARRRRILVSDDLSANAFLTVSTKAFPNQPNTFNA